MFDSIRFVVGEINPCVEDRANIDNTGANEGKISGGNHEYTGAKMGEDVGSMVEEKL